MILPDKEAKMLVQVRAILTDSIVDLTIGRGDKLVVDELRRARKLIHEVMEVPLRVL